jgi:hypothetical protein
MTRRTINLNRWAERHRPAVRYYLHTDPRTEVVQADTDRYELEGADTDLDRVIAHVEAWDAAPDGDAA